MLAIAVNTFDRVSETFVRAHVKHIAPGRTVLLCRESGDAVDWGFPVLFDLRVLRTPHGLIERVVNGVRFRWWRYVDPALRGADEARVRAFLSRHKVRAVLAEFGPNGSLLRLACKRAGVPLYVHFHGYDATRLARLASVRRHYRRLFRDATGIIAPSRFLANRLVDLGCPVEKVHVSPCGIDLPEAATQESTLSRFIAVGRLVEKKSPLSTLRAFSEVARGDDEASLDLVGDGPLLEACRAEVKSLGLSHRVTLHGALPHDAVLRLMKESFAFVQHSVEASDGDCEGLPVSILEAMGSGLPVVSTWHSGIPEAVLDGETGLLVAEHDVEGMAKAINTLLKNRSRAKEMGRAGCARVKANFTHEHTAARLREIMGLEDLVENYDEVRLSPVETQDEVFLHE